jgi:hypothetical protein
MGLDKKEYEEKMEEMRKGKSQKLLTEFVLVFIIRIKRQSK